MTYPGCGEAISVFGAMSEDHTRSEFCISAGQIHAKFPFVYSLSLPQKFQFSTELECMIAHIFRFEHGTGVRDRLQLRNRIQTDKKDLYAFLDYLQHIFAGKSRKRGNR